MPSLLDQSIETLPGIGPRSAAVLRKRGYQTVGDLLWLMPLRYDDQRHPTPIHELCAGAYAVVVGRVRSARRFPHGGRMGLDVRLEPVEASSPGDGYPELKLVWFRAAPGILKRFEVGAHVRVAGRVHDYRGMATIAHPEWLSPQQPGAIEPRYPEMEGIRAKALQRAVRSAVGQAAHQVPDLIPDTVRQEVGVGRLADALVSIHVPNTASSEHDRIPDPRAQQRLALEELVLWELALRVRRAKERAGRAQSFAAEPAVTEACAALPFELTDAQWGAVRVLAEDLGRGSPMKRLLQGDVGCGKTAVALVACAQVVTGGAQAVFLAPTELLAEQHAATLKPIADRIGLRLGVFTGTLSKDRRRAMLDRMATGAVDMVVGTHALLSGEIRFANLGLVVVDEQHRFGVSQRLRLGRGRAGRQPHLIVMTATPIPRSLALVLYAGLDLTVIDEKPPGRLPTTTRMVSRTNRAAILRQIERALQADGRAFVVCPAIRSSDGLVGVDDTIAEMQDHFGEALVAQIHGELASEVRRARMRDFVDGAIKVLVGTTVLEVGVDVPDANIIVVEQAERFGLAQLHQLRGRVGRAGQRSACLLTHEASLSAEAGARLEALCATDDGFRLAETDLALRGPGHLFGYRQSGASGLQFANLEDRQLLEQASHVAERMIGFDPELELPEHAAARAAVHRWEAFEAVREEAG